jgi:TonB family protein
MDANLKPWHMKVDYQINDEKGNPSESGVFEFWWASPKVYRSTLTRGQSSHSDWHTADGGHFTQAAGAPFEVFEYWLQSALVSALPTSAELDPSESTLVDHSDLSTNGHTRCVVVVPTEGTDAASKSLPFGKYPEYCVNRMKPLLLGIYRFGSILIRCNNIVQMQGKSIPREVSIVDGDHQALYAKVEPFDTALSPTDPALTPPADAISVKVEKSDISFNDASKLLIKKVAPVYPQDAKSAKTQGKVILRTTIGPDGSVRDAELVSAPSPSLALSAFHAVSQWQYKPYSLGGQAATVETTVEVDFSL